MRTYRGGTRRKAAKACPYAASCFECLLKDCIVDDGNVNEILSSELYLELLGERIQESRPESCHSPDGKTK